jgi:chromosome segregation ATPase
MISFSIALAFCAVVIVFGMRDMQRFAGAQRLVLAELQAKATLREEALAERLIEAQGHVAQAQDEVVRTQEALAEHKVAIDKLHDRLTTVENRLNRLTVPGVMR